MEKVLLTKDETSYQRFMESLPVGFYSCDSKGRITFFNKKAVELWGDTPELENIRFCACYKVRWPDGSYVPPEKTPVALALKSGKSFQDVEVWIERPDGSKFYASFNVNPMFDAKGNLTGAINMFQDITNRKLAEIALLESEDQYRRLIESLPAAIYTCDALGQIKLFNDAAVELWGREPNVSEDLWCGSWKIYHMDGTPMSLDECPMAIAIKEGRSVVGEIIIIEQPNGNRRYVAPHPQPIFDSAGKLKGAVNMLMDVTEEKKTGSILRDSEERLRLAIDAAELGTWDMDIASGAVITSERHRQIIGYNKGIPWDRKKFLSRVHPDDLSMVEEAFKNAMDSGKLFYEARIITPNNNVRWIRINGVTISHNGVPFRILGTIMDITLQRETRDELERTIAQRTRELTRLNQQLEKSNYDLEQFAYIASHAP